MKLRSSKGVLRYSRTDDGGYRLVVEVDPGIIEVARALVPKSVRLNRQKFAPHITVVRKEVPPNTIWWGAFEGHTTFFKYNPIIVNDDTYWWLEVHSSELVRMRVMLGLPEMSELTRPPDGKHCFHATVGNTKDIA